MTVRTPEGYARVASWIISRDTDAELEFLAAVFGAVEKPGSRVMAGERVNHVEAELGGTAVMLFDASPDWPATPAHTRIYVADVKATVDSAIALGARLVTEPRELPFGDVVARFRDPQGHLWWVHEHLEDVPVDEMTRRFGEQRYQEALEHVGSSLVAEFERVSAAANR